MTFFIIILCLVFHVVSTYKIITVFKLGQKYGHSASFKLQNIGSDELARPDDENSPEFKEYLRNLLRMQANRAKTGFSAPSSGSADAYTAKLTRLKIEQRRRRELGLPDERLDASYRPEDYKAALLESQDPLISDKVLTGEAAIPKLGVSATQSNRKLRQLTPEEIRIADEAEARVQQALEDYQRKGIVAKSPEMPIRSTSRPRPKNEPDEIDTAIDKFFQPKPSNEIKAFKPTVPIDDSNKILSTAATSALQVTKVQQQQEQSRKQPIESKVPVEVLTSTETKVAKKSDEVENFKAVSSKISKSISSNVKPIEKAAELQLDQRGTEIVGRTLQSLVKHRGGGPFGSGRLVGSEVETLIETLHEVTDYLSNETSEHAPIQSISYNPIPVDEPTSVNYNQFSSGVTDNILPSGVNENQVAFEVPTSQLGFTNTHDKLQNPSRLTQLEELRENLLESLASIQIEISTLRKQLSNGQLPVSDVIPEQSLIQSDQTISTNSSINKEVKLVLGLLLKHRGGPGFGHGRLQEKELELLVNKLRSVSTELLLESS